MSNTPDPLAKDSLQLTESIDSSGNSGFYMKKNNYKKKTKLYIYSWVYNGKQFILKK